MTPGNTLGERTETPGDMRTPGNMEIDEETDTESIQSDSEYEIRINPINSGNFRKLKNSRFEASSLDTFLAIGN